MKKQEINRGKMFAISAQLPEQTKTYTVIPHAKVIELIEGGLQTNNFNIVNSTFDSSHLGDVLVARYYTEDMIDDDMRLSFQFTNSYDKTTRFHMNVCCYIPQSNSVMMFDNYSYSRRHTGNGDKESYDNIMDTIRRSKDSIKQFIELKKCMIDQQLSKEEFGRLLGELVILRMMNVTQMCSALRNKKKSYFGLDEWNLWEIFNAILEACNDGSLNHLQERQLALQMFIYSKYCNIEKKTPTEVMNELF